MGHALAKEVVEEVEEMEVSTAQATPARPQLRLLPVLKLGVNKDLLERGPAQLLCRASNGGSCDINCTGTDITI